MKPPRRTRNVARLALLFVGLVIFCAWMTGCDRVLSTACSVQVSDTTWTHIVARGDTLPVTVIIHRWVPCS